mmetsp:Transcript_24620/g.28031  ORF Transcript_24620/g.28031 Transcript_24620/m.28031 type:complete len:224 (-) Transcript_24620:1011-1682(-)
METAWPYEVEILNDATFEKDIPATAALEYYTFQEKMQDFSLSEKTYVLCQIELALRNRQQKLKNTAIIRNRQGTPIAECSLKFYGEKEKQPDDSWFCDNIGCCNTCRLGCFSMIFDGDAPPKEVCYLASICVGQNYRGKGLGTKLMQWAEEKAKKANCHTIALDVAATNPRAAALYERVGYSIVKKSNLCCLSLCLTHSKFYHMRKPLNSAEPLLLPRQSAAI